jgi:hypothetical protein
MQCFECSNWSHVTCYGYWEGSIALKQSTHICFDCKKAKGEIFPLFERSHFVELSIFRRALFLMWEEGWNKNANKIASKLGNALKQVLDNVLLALLIT